jgi:hypothetical protein
MKIRKHLIGLSLLFNVILAFLAYLSFTSNSLAVKENKFIDQTRLSDTKMMESLLVGRISKQQTLDIFRQNFKENAFFDKPSESGVGAGNLFLVFDDQDMLSKIEAYPFNGP